MFLLYMMYNALLLKELSTFYDQYIYDVMTTTFTTKWNKLPMKVFVRLLIFSKTAERENNNNIIVHNIEIYVLVKTNYCLQKRSFITTGINRSL